MASPAQKQRISTLLRQLEADAPSPAESDWLVGQWRLLYTTDAVYWSSPFFWAFRQLCADMTSPVQLVPEDRRTGGAEQWAKSVFALTDGIPFKRVGPAMQTIGPGELGELELLSEVIIYINIFDNVLSSAQSTMTTRSAFLSTSEASLQVQSTMVKQSSIAKLLPFVDELSFPTSGAFPQLKAGSNQVGMSSTCLSPSLRLSRHDQETCNVPGLARPTSCTANRC